MISTEINIQTLNQIYSQKYHDDNNNDNDENSISYKLDFISNNNKYYSLNADERILFKKNNTNLNGLILKEDWCWDLNNKSNKVDIDKSAKYAYFFRSTFSEGTAGVRGTKGFKSGIHYFEIKINKFTNATSIMVGYGTSNTCLNYDGYEYIDLIGNNNQSWGLNHRGFIVHNSIKNRYCDKFSDNNTIIGVLLDLYENTLKFYKNGVPLGVAFKNIQSKNKTETLYPIISSTASDIEIKLIRQFRIFKNLEEICLNKIKETVNVDNYDNLNLPKLITDKLKIIS